MILEEGIKFNPISINPEDSQFLETRKFQLGEIARIFHVPPHMLADVEKSTSWGTGIEEQNIGFCTYTMNPWFTLWEEELCSRLLLEKEKDDYFFKFDKMELLRGDALKHAQADILYKRNGVINADEVRAWKDMNPIPGGLGKEYIVEKNMIGLSDLGADIIPKEKDTPTGDETKI
jgi:HK97 family phage portal protein